MLAGPVCSSLQTIQEELLLLPQLGTEETRPETADQGSVAGLPGLEVCLNSEHSQTTRGRQLVGALQGSPSGKEAHLVGMLWQPLLDQGSAWAE